MKCCLKSMVASGCVSAKRQEQKKTLKTINTGFFRRFAREGLSASDYIVVLNHCVFGLWLPTRDRYLPKAVLLEVVAQVIEISRAITPAALVTAISSTTDAFDWAEIARVRFVGQALALLLQCLEYA